jgi:hypothetical protein
MNLSVLKQPSALIPLGMSLAAIALLGGYVAMFGLGATEPAGHDEGAAARIFQLLLVAQLPVIGFFALKWLPRAPRQALLVLALQGGAGLAALATVYVLEHL